MEQSDHVTASMSLNPAKIALLASLCTVAEFVIGVLDRARRGRRRKLRRKREGRMH